MRKYALAFVMALVAATASAVEVGVEYQDQDGKNGSPSSSNYQLGVKQQVSNFLALDVKTFQAVADTSTGVSSTQLEAGATGTYSLPYVTPYTRVALGQRYTTTANYTYYSVEPGVIVPVASTGLTATLGYRFRSATDSQDEWTTRTWRSTLGYSLTKSDTVYVGYDRMRGDVQAGLTRVGYNHSF